MQYEEELKFSKFTEQNESLRNLPQDCSKCHIYSSDSNSKQKIKRKIKNRIFICPKCHHPPKIKFLKYNKLRVICNCRKFINMPPRKFISFFGKRKNYENYFFCNNSNHAKGKFKYEFYCNYCRCNFCKECVRLKLQKMNHIKELRPLISDNIIDKINKIQQLIKDIQPNLDSADSENRQIINIIITIIYSYYDSLCYNQFHNILECENYLKEFKNRIQDIKMLETIKISNFEDLNYFDTFNDSHLISSIKINYQDNIDLSKLKYFNFEKLKTIQINHCNLKDLSGLKDIKNKEQIKQLDLEYNLIDDNNLKNIANFKNIRFLNLFDNNLINYEVLDFCQRNFNELETLYLGKNKFIINKEYNEKYYFNDLKVLGITECFTNNTAHLISNIICQNLKSLYICGNDLESIKFMKSFESENITEFWAKENNLKNISELGLLKSKNSLEIINLEKNKIEELDWLYENIKEFPNLKELNLIDNSLSKEAEEIIEKIIEKTNYKLKIILKEK